jgi:hypothetical protein
MPQSAHCRRLLLHWAVLQRQRRQILVAGLQRLALCIGCAWKSIANHIGQINRPTTPVATFCATLPPFSRPPLRVCYWSSVC